MHKSILLILLFFASCPLLSQEIDSLLQLLQSSDSLANAQRVAINLKLAKLHRRVKPVEQLKVTRDAFKEASSIKDMKSQGIAMSEIGS